jgi:hypothetical protein
MVEQFGRTDKQLLKQTNNNNSSNRQTARRTTQRLLSEGRQGNVNWIRFSSLPVMKLLLFVTTTNGSAGIDRLSVDPYPSRRKMMNISIDFVPIVALEHYDIPDRRKKPEALATPTTNPRKAKSLFRPISSAVRP